MFSCSKPRSKAKFCCCFFRVDVRSLVAVSSTRYCTLCNDSAPRRHATPRVHHVRWREGLTVTGCLTSSPWRHYPHNTSATPAALEKNKIMKKKYFEKNTKEYLDVQRAPLKSRVRAGKKSTAGKKRTPKSLVFEPRASM